MAMRNAARISRRETHVERNAAHQREHGMGVDVDEAGSNQTAIGVHDPGCGNFRGELISRAGENNAVSGDSESALLDHRLGGIAGQERRAQPVIKQGALGIAGNRIVFTGARDQLPAEIPAARIVDADGRLVTPGFVNIHTHAVLSLMRGIALDMGFAPAYTRGVPHGHDITEDEAVALARLGALESLTFGSTTMDDSYVHAHVTLPAMADIGLRDV